MSETVTGELKRFYDAEMAARAQRPLGDERLRCLGEFVTTARRLACNSVLEVGCGAGRDGVAIQGAGFAYTGVDLSTSAVHLCRQRGLRAVEAVATALPFAEGSFDAAWSMSTLMHLPGDQFAVAIEEIRRVIRPGGLVEIGVWGHSTDREWTKPDGRYFKHRSDDSLRSELARLGEVTSFATWDWYDDGGHYQWARVRSMPRPG